MRPGGSEHAHNRRRIACEQRSIERQTNISSPRGVFRGKTIEFAHEVVNTKMPVLAVHHVRHKGVIALCRGSASDKPQPQCPNPLGESVFRRTRPQLSPQLHSP